MVAQPEETGPPFKDYCLILQLHPEADAEMVDTAYWHLARRYSDARRTDSSAKAKMDDLNEAYSVLRSSARREEYFRIRNALLGEGALPTPHEPAPEAPPLAVMEKQRPRPPEPVLEPQDRAPSRLRFAQVTAPSWQHALVAILILVLGGTAVLAGAHPVMVAALLSIAVTLVIVPLLRRLPGLLPALPRLALYAPPVRLPGLGKESLPRRSLDPDAIHQSTEQIRNRLRQGGDHEASWPSSSPDPQPDAQPSGDPGGAPTATS